MSNCSQIMNNFQVFLLFSILASTPLLAGSADLEEIVVTGTQSEHSSWHSPISTQSLQLEENAPPQNLADFLSQQSRFELSPSIRGRTLRLQGLEGKHILVLRDGQRISGKVGDSLDLESIDLSGIERVEVISGAGSALYGSEAVGGVINLISRRREASHARGALAQDLKLSQSSDQRSQLSAQGTIHKETSEHLLFFRKNLSAPQNKSGSEATRFSGRDTLAIGIRQDWQLRPELKLLTKIGFESDKLKGTDVSGAGAVWDRSNAIQRHELALAPQLKLSPTTELSLDSQVQIYSDRYQSELRRRPEEQQQEKAEEKLTQHTLKLQTAAGLDHLLTFGLEELSETLKANRLNRSKVKRQRLALFMQDEYSLNESLLLVPGLRLEDDSQYATQTLGKFALRYAWDEWTVLRPSYGQAYRAPSFKELYLRFENPAVGYIVEGSPDLKPERSEQWQLSLDHLVNDKQNLSCTLFHNTIRDLIGTTAEPLAGTQYYRYKNLTRVRTRGIDSSWTLKERMFQLQVSHHFLEAKDLLLQRDLEARPRQRLSYRLSQLPLSDKISLAHAASFTGPQTLYDAEAKPYMADSTFYGSADLRYLASANWSGSFTVENLTNAAEDRVLEIRPRSFILGVSWNHTILSEEGRP